MNKKSGGLSGQTIIEAVIAVAIISTIIVAMVSAVTLSLGTSTIAKNKSRANQFVQEGLEAVRSIKEISWTDLTAQDGQTKGVKSVGGVWQFTEVGDDSIVSSAPGFTRRVVIEDKGSEQVQVTVTVSWTQGAKSLNSQNSTVFTKWK